MSLHRAFRHDFANERRPTPIAIDTFKLKLVLEDNEYVAFAESDVFVRRFVSQMGEEIGEG